MRKKNTNAHIGAKRKGNTGEGSYWIKEGRKATLEIFSQGKNTGEKMNGKRKEHWSKNAS
jgi:hypothetical protein